LRPQKLFQNAEKSFKDRSGHDEEVLAGAQNGASINTFRSWHGSRK